MSWLAKSRQFDGTLTLSQFCPVYVRIRFDGYWTLFEYRPLAVGFEVGFEPVDERASFAVGAGGGVRSELAEFGEEGFLFGGQRGDVTGCGFDGFGGDVFVIVVIGVVAVGVLKLPLPRFAIRAVPGRADGASVRIAVVRWESIAYLPRPDGDTLCASSTMRRS